MLKTLLAVAVVVPAGHHHYLTPSHRKDYQHAYASVAHKLGTRAPGRNIVKDGDSSGRPVTDREVVRSLAVLRRMLAPPVIHVVATQPTLTQTPTPTPVAASTTSAPATSTTSVPTGSLVSCIIAHESGGNPQAVSPNGKYGGIGQWSSTAWAQDGGTQYASSPTGASYSQQLAVLNGEGAAGQQQQQGQYDGC